METTSTKECDTVSPWSHFYSNISKVGSGSFGAVYVAELKGGKKVALKRVNSDILPLKIVKEMGYLEVAGHNTALVPTFLDAFRDKEGCVLVMDYFEHDDFKLYKDNLNAIELQQYMKQLLAALEHVHSKGLIHRDVKPRNFLFHRATMRGCLVDFGLTEDLRKWDVRQSDLLNHRKRMRCSLEDSDTSEKEPASEDRFVCPLSPPQEKGQFTSRLLGGRPDRAGTPGFRPPEVLLGSWEQCTKIDVWSAAVVFLSLLSHRYPFFPNFSNQPLTDEVSLLQIAGLIGPQQIVEAGVMLFKSVVLPDAKALGYEEQRSFSVLIHHSYTQDEYDMCDDDSNAKGCDSKPLDQLKSDTDSFKRKVGVDGERTSQFKFTNGAAELLGQMLQAAPSNRVSATEALYGNFFRRLIPKE